MDVARPARPFRLALLIAGLHLAAGAFAHADPMYTAIDLGTGIPTYGTDSSGNGTVAGSSGQTYIFNPAQNDLPSQWASTSVGVPIVEPAPVGNPLTYGNPNFAYSDSKLTAMNSQGLAAGFNTYGVAGHLGYSDAFVTQQQPNGSWGPPIGLWSGAVTIDGGTQNIGIVGVSANGQVLGYGVENPNSGYNIMETYLYDTKTQSLTNLTKLVDSMPWTNSTQLPLGQSSNWFLWSVVGQIDAQGRLLVEATEGPYSTTLHNLLLIPQGPPPDQVPAPEPASWAAFAMLIGGWMIHHRIRSRSGR